jgi:Ca2+ regulator and membrane fusion protein Fig1
MPPSHPDISSPANENLASTLANLARNATIEVRTGFFKLCVSHPRAAGGWKCGTNATALSLEYGAGEDPLNLIATSSIFSSKIVFYGFVYVVPRPPRLLLVLVLGDRQPLTETTNRLTSIILATAAVLLLSTFPGWHSEYTETGSEYDFHPFPRRHVSHLVIACLGVSMIFSGISVLWQHVAAVAVATSTTTLIGGAVKSHVGTAGMALAWAATFLLAIPTLGALIMSLSIQLLDKLTEDD